MMTILIPKDEELSAEKILLTLYHLTEQTDILHHARYIEFTGNEASPEMYIAHNAIVIVDCSRVSKPEH